MVSNGKLNRREPIFNKIPAAIFIIFTSILFIELYIQIFGNRMRSIFLLYIAFFPGTFLSESDQLFVGHRYTMFFTYSLLHANLTHLVLNAAVLVAIGKRIGEELNFFGIIFLFFSTAFSGAFFYLIFLPSHELPMIGASGSAFGFLGYLKAKEVINNNYEKLLLKSTVTFFLILILSNFLFILISPFGIAWQAHLGGLFCGIFLAFLPRYF